VWGKENRGSRNENFKTLVCIGLRKKERKKERTGERGCFKVELRIAVIHKAIYYHLSYTVN
jgi:hypothetical protein